jgi:acyl-CoA synthetase (AMP-forming)/AMP-acid ligase II
MVIRGGENISVAEVEAVLEAHPAVRQAVAVGVPDARLGERLVAFVVASKKFDVAACRTWFERQGVARFKTPERILQLERLPTLAAGKPDRSTLKEMALRRRT